MILDGFASGVYGHFSDYLLWWGLFFSLLIHTWCFFKFFPRKKHPRCGLFLGNALVFLSMMGCVGIVAESYLRFLAVETDSFGVSLSARKWFLLYTHHNALGFRDHEWSKDKPDNVKRIAFIGDSFTYGWGIQKVEERFTDLLQAKFDQRSPDSVEVMNVSKPGWDTQSQLQPIRDMIEQYDVDEIVLCYVPNDIEGLIPVTQEFNPTRPPDWQLINLDSSCLVDYIYRRVYLPRLPTVKGYHDWLAEGYADPKIWQQQQQHLVRLSQICNDNNVTFRVVLLPYTRTSGEKWNPEKLHETLKQFFVTNHIPVIDLLPTISNIPTSELVVNSQDAHPNEKAHKIFAEYLWKKIKE